MQYHLFHTRPGQIPLIGLENPGAPRKMVLTDYPLEVWVPDPYETVLKTGPQAWLKRAPGRALTKFNLEIEKLSRKLLDFKHMAIAIRHQVSCIRFEPDQDSLGFFFYTVVAFTATMTPPIPSNSHTISFFPGIPINLRDLDLKGIPLDEVLEDSQAHVEANRELCRRLGECFSIGVRGPPQGD